MQFASIDVVSHKKGRIVKSFSYGPDRIPNSFSSIVGLNCELLVTLNQWMTFFTNVLTNWHS